MALNKSRVFFILAHQQAIKLACAGTKIFPSVKMAQAILESTGKVKNEWIAGASKLAFKYNNFFGIKDQANDEWHGDKVNLPTREVIKGKSVTVDSFFRVYDSPLASFQDHSKFLQKNPRYKKAGVFDAETPEEQAHKLQAAGYATDPNYAKLLIGIIQAYGLKDLDK